MKHSSFDHEEGRHMEKLLLKKSVYTEKMKKLKSLAHKRPKWKMMIMSVIRLEKPKEIQLNGEV